MRAATGADLAGTATGSWPRAHGNGGMASCARPWGTTTSAWLRGPSHMGTAIGAWPRLPLYDHFIKYSLILSEFFISHAKLKTEIQEDTSDGVLSLSFLFDNCSLSNM